MPKEAKFFLLLLFIIGGYLKLEFQKSEMVARRTLKNLVTLICTHSCVYNHNILVTAQTSMMTCLNSGLSCHR